MRSIYLYIMSLLVVVGVVSTPAIIKQKVSDVIEVEKQTMLKNGLELKVIKNEGYFNSLRDIELTLIDAEKFSDYFLNELAKNSSSYKNLSDMLKKEDRSGLRNAFDGFTFKGTIKNSNLLLGNTNIELSLAKFSDEMMKNIGKDKKVEEFVNSLINEKTLTLLVSLDSEQKVSEITMKDIDKNINSTENEVTFKLKSHKLNLNNGDRMSGEYVLGEQLLSIKNASTKAVFVSEGINYKFDYLDQFDNEGNFHVNTFEVKEDKTYRNIAFKIDNFDIKNSIKTVDNMLKANVSYSIKDIYFNDRKEFKLKDLVFKLDVLDINKDDIINTSNAYNKVIFQSKRVSKNDRAALVDSLTNILNKGFKTNFELSFAGLTLDNMKLGNIDFSLKGNLKENNDNLNGIKFLNSLLVNGAITMSEEDKNTISKLNRQLKKIADLGKKEGSKITFNFAFKDSNLLINGNKI